MDHIERGRKVARAIFAMGDMPGDRAQRLEFKGGTYPKHETCLGGLCEAALAQAIARALTQIEPARPECICPKCGIRHGGSTVDGGF